MSKQPASTITQDTGYSTDVRFRNSVKALGHAQLQHAITLDDQIGDGAYRLYALYLMYAQDKDLCWPGRARIAEMRGVGEATVTRWNKELVDAGYISVTPLSIEATQPDHLGVAAFLAGPTEDR